MDHAEFVEHVKQVITDLLIQFGPNVTVALLMLAIKIAVSQLGGGK